MIAGPDHAAWITDGGQNAIVRVGWPERAVRVFPLPAGTRNANLNTATFDADGDLWFTGQSGIVGKLAVRTAQVTVQDAPRGNGPYGICTTPRGEVWWCSLAGSFIARIDRASGASTVVEPPTPRQGARRIWSDSHGRLWVSEWLSGNLSMYDPANASWRTWRAPGPNPRPMPSTSTSATRSGLATGGTTRSSRSTRRARSSSASRSRRRRRRAPDPRPERRDLAARKRHRAHRTDPHCLRRYGGATPLVRRCCASCRGRPPAPPRRATSRASGAAHRTRRRGRRSTGSAFRHGPRSRPHRRARSATPARA